MADPKQSQQQDEQKPIITTDPEAIENRYWKRTLGSTSLSDRGNRSFWD